MNEVPRRSSGKKRRHEHKTKERRTDKQKKNRKSQMKQKDKVKIGMDPGRSWRAVVYWPEYEI